MVGRDHAMTARIGKATRGKRYNGPRIRKPKEASP